MALKMMSFMWLWRCCLGALLLLLLFSLWACWAISGNDRGCWESSFFISTDFQLRCTSFNSVLLHVAFIDDDRPE